MKNIVYFDLETQKSAQEVGGWDHIRDMRMSVGVTYSTAAGQYRIYSEDRVDDLINQIFRADLVVGFNHIRFDYEVLHRYTVIDLSQVPALDLMLDLQKTLNRRLSLESLATATLGTRKTAEGLQAIQWYKQGHLVKIAEYCCFDVKITRLLHEYGNANRKVYYRDRFGARNAIPVRW